MTIEPHIPKFLHRLTLLALPPRCPSDQTTRRIISQLLRTQAVYTGCRQAGALNETLEASFGQEPQTTGAGILPRGDGISALPSILREFTHRIMYWMLDIEIGVEKVQFQISVRSTSLSADCSAHRVPNSRYPSDQRRRLEKSPSSLRTSLPAASLLSSSAPLYSLQAFSFLGPMYNCTWHTPLPSGIG